LRHDVNFEARNRAEIDADEEYHAPAAPAEGKRSSPDEPGKIPRAGGE
jgi:hypothetical protein